MIMHGKITRRAGLGILAVLVMHAAGAQDARPEAGDSSRPPDQSAAKSLPTLWIAGDSTVRNNGFQRGWGQDLERFLDGKKIEVRNRAIGGRSSRTFFTEGRWDKMLAGMKKGDVVLIQFGHNDAGPPDERSKFRGSVKGIGDQTELVKKPDGSVETVHSFGWYLKHFVRTAKAKGATVVLCSPIPHLKFDRAGKFVRDWESWRPWVKACAVAEGVLYLDLAEIIGSQYAAMDPAKVAAFFADKGTHTNAAGALFNARAVIGGLQALPENPLGAYLKEVP